MTWGDYASDDLEPSLEWSKTVLVYGPFSGRTFADVANAAEWGCSAYPTPSYPLKEKAEKAWCRQQIQIESQYEQRQSFLEFLRHVEKEQSSAINDFVTGMHHEEDSAQLQFMEEHEDFHASLICEQHAASLKTTPESPVQHLQRVVVSELAPAVHLLTEMMFKQDSCVSPMSNTLNVISGMCATIGVSLVQIFKWKMGLNAIKYPAVETNHIVASVRSIPKYTEISHATKYKEDNANPLFLQATSGKLLTQAYILQEVVDREQQLHSMLHDFAKERGWLDQYSVSGLALSLWAEFGEVCSALEYCKSGGVEFTLKTAVAKELADLTIYMFHFARLKGISLSKRC
jgi:hypothetical protein